MTVKLRMDGVILYQVPGGGVLTPVTGFQNSLHQCRITPPGGHRPLTYAQWCPDIYTRYRVYGIKYTITVKNRSTMPEMWWLIARGYRKEPGVPWGPDQNLQTALERSDAKWKMGGSWARISGYMSVAKVAGVPSSQIKNEDDWSAQYNTDPTELAGIIFSISQNNAQTQPFDINVR